MSTQWHYENTEQGEKKWQFESLPTHCQFSAARFLPGRPGEAPDAPGFGTRRASGSGGAGEETGFTQALWRRA